MSTNIFIYVVFLILSMISLQKRGQVTVFIIIGILIVAAIGLYFLINDSFLPGGSKELKQGEDAYLACISDRAKLGINLLGQQGGHLYLEELKFYPGSSYAPSSSQLDFYGGAVPYWMFVSGNNLVVEQKPSIEKMNQELTRFIYEGINDCNFDSLNSAGIFVDVYDGSVDVAINSDSVEVSLNNPIFITFENQSATVDKHEVTVKSKLGKFYNLASKIYEKEKAEGFLEEYGLDVMYLYAPVTGVDFGCSPRIFNEDLTKRNISLGLEDNIAFLKVAGNYYDLSNKRNSYFVVDLGEKVDENVNFLYSSSWPTSVQMYGDKVVQPIGTQQGLNMFGLCFVPYHFVYDIKFPVLVQFFDGNELFQFGVVAIIKNSQSREAILTGEEFINDNVICANADKKVRVSTYDLDLNPVEARLSFSCLDETCDLGSTKKVSSDESYLVADVPSCVNGILHAYSENYTSSSYIISTNREDQADMILKKIHTINVSMASVGKANIVFSSNDYTSVFSYPEDKVVRLTEGEYNITAYVYSNTSISFTGIKQQKCLDVPSSSIGGIFGSTESKCFDLDIPAQTIDSAIVGGGSAEDYFTDELLTNYNELRIDVPTFKIPTSITDLESNYAQWEVSRVELNFR
jgi:hypothetical protein